MLSRHLISRDCSAANDARSGPHGRMPMSVAQSAVQPCLNYLQQASLTTLLHQLECRTKPPISLGLQSHSCILEIVAAILIILPSVHCYAQNSAWYQFDVCQAADYSVVCMSAASSAVIRNKGSWLFCECMNMLTSSGKNLTIL